MSVRAGFLTVHRWLGVGLAVLLLLQGLTGAVLVFRKEANLLLHPGALLVRPEGAARPVSDLLALVGDAHPGATVARIEYPASPDQAFLFRLQQDGTLRLAAVDPYRATVLRSAGLAGWPVELLYQWHDNFLAGAPGLTLVGFLGLGLLLMTVSGPVLWWPGRRRLGQGFRPVLGAGSYRAVLDLHRIGGVLLALLLAGSAVTGIGMAWRGSLLAALSPLMPTAAAPAPAVAERPDRALLPLDAVVAAVRGEAGGLPVRNVRFPGGHSRVVLVFLEDAGAGRPRAVRQVWADGYTGAVLATYGAGSAAPGNAFLDWMLPLHAEIAAGLPGRLLVLAGGLALAALAGSGVWIWWRKRGFRRSLAAKRAAAVSAP